MNKWLKLAAGCSAALFLNAAAGAFCAPPALTSSSGTTVAAVTEQSPAQNASLPLQQKLLNNQYLRQSIQNSDLAKSAFTSGDYDSALRYSQEASRYARLSDEYIKTRVTMDAANKKISEAASRLAWADNSGARKYYANDYNTAKALYQDALTARSSNDWDGALDKAINVVEILATIRAPPDKAPAAGAASPAAPAQDASQQGALPAQYIVRPWDTYGDCFWNIAACPWA
jgi:hypothetical protein